MAPFSYAKGFLGSQTYNLDCLIHIFSMVRSSAERHRRFRERKKESGQFNEYRRKKTEAMKIYRQVNKKTVQGQ